MIVRDIYNVISSSVQNTFFSKEFSCYEVVNANTETPYHYSECGDEIYLGDDHSEIFSKDWVLDLPVVDITAWNHTVIIWVDG